MKKIPTLFQRDFEGSNGRFVTTEVTPGCEWVLAGEGVATRKWNGTCVALLDLGQDPAWSSAGLAWWVRRELKPGAESPHGFMGIARDEVTGKVVGWFPAERDGRWSEIQEAISRQAKPADDWGTGTYELVGPKVNRNPDAFGVHTLVPHGTVLLDAPRDYDGLRTFLFEEEPLIEGVVFWRCQGDPDSPMAKIKRRDFPR